jgi:hypothetical protein
MKEMYVVGERAERVTVGIKGLHLDGLRSSRRRK